jgi:hypothetical protein
MELWLAAFLAIVAMVMAGAAIGIWICSSRSLCPYHLRRRLDSWYKEIAKKNRRHRARHEEIRIPTPIEDPEADDPDGSGGKAA